MAGPEVRTRSVHELAVEEKAKDGVSLAQYVAIFTAILSAIAAVVSYYGGTMQGRAMLFKEEAVIKQTQASETWALFQSKSTKAYLMEFAAVMSPDVKTRKKYQKEIVRYQQEKEQIKIRANALESASRLVDAKSDKLLVSYRKTAQAMVLLQIAISLASITVLTRKTWLLYFAGAAAVIGSGLAIFS